MKIEVFSPLVMMSLYWLWLCNRVLLVSGLCLDDQKALLLQLKDNLAYRSSSRLNWWNASHDCCTWMGVTCDEEGHVIGLDLSQEFIHGGFHDSSVLFSLQHLQKLNLAYNSFFSEIPCRFNKLDKLTYLNLSQANFVGQIPKEISQLTRLITLDFSGYYFGQGLKLDNPNLRKLVQNLTSIRQLYLDGVNISASGHEWCNALLPLHDLKELSMSRCNLLGPLDPSLATLENLSVIVLDGNNLSSSVPETFAHFKHLTILSLHRCGLTGTFPHKIFNVGTLSLIDISENYNLHGFFPEFPMNGSLQTLRVSWTSFVGALPHSIGNIRHLAEFGLSYCGFNGIIPDSLSNLTELSYLDLSNNKFIGTIPSSQFEGLHNLVSVNLDNNYFTGSIPSSFFTLRSLQLLWLSNNKFSQLDDLINVASSILEFLAFDCNSFKGSTQLNKFSEFRNLAEIDLSYNNVSANVNFINVEPPFFPSLELLVLASCDLRNFPGFLRNLSTLVALDISNNHIQGKVPNWIWEMPNLLFLKLSHNLLTELEGPSQYITSRLHFLDLHHNKLQGPVPIFSGNATYLDFSGNKFSSSIPGDIVSYLPLIIFLSLSNNTLHGSIPDSLCNATYIKVLDLSINKISGRIPSCLMKMSKNFEVLNLKNNNLSGSIPDTILPYCALWTINLHGNLLDGPIPKSIVNCSKLEVLDLGSNQIIGGFPCLLKEISQLRILVLRKNKFQGPLRCLKANNATWEMLQILDIAFNNFSGKLAGSFLTTWKKYMMHNEHLAESKFIEKEIGLGGPHYQDSVTINNKGQEMELVKILTIYTSIDFSSNHFEGPIPEKLMDFNELIILNLSNNALSGKIPSSIGNLIQLESLDLSRNSLSGEIPMQLVSLSFLEYLNLSFNHLVGKIPTGTQLQSFPASSFEGNDGLYGPPLPSIENRNGTEPRMLPQRKCGRLACTVDWNFISVELGLVFGHGIVFGPLLIWKGWRIRYWKLIHKILCWIFPQMYLEYLTQREQTHATLRWGINDKSISSSS